MTQADAQNAVLPPGARSAAAQGLNEAAQRGEFALQVCPECSTVQYPVRDVCSHCLHTTLNWQAVPDTGTLRATTTLHHSNDAYFRERLPWRIGTVQLDCGPFAIAHLPEGGTADEPVRLNLELDAGGVAVLVARPKT